MTPAEFEESTRTDDSPPAALSDALTALWHAKAGDWDAAHSIAQEIHTPLGSHIHAHLHVIEGDLGNAAYWYRKAGQPPKSPQDLPADWAELVQSALREAGQGG